MVEGKTQKNLPIGVILKRYFKIFVKFTEKHLCRSLLVNNIVRKGSPAQMASFEFCEVLKNTNFVEHQ